jgi:hypothetical protein
VISRGNYIRFLEVRKIERNKLIYQSTPHPGKECQLKRHDCLVRSRLRASLVRGRAIAKFKVADVLEKADHLRRHRTVAAPKCTEPPTLYHPSQRHAKVGNTSPYGHAGRKRIHVEYYDTTASRTCKVNGQSWARDGKAGAR